MNKIRLLAAFALVALATTAAARPFVDQQAPYGVDTITVGGTPNLIVAQTVTAGLTGDLMRVELGVGCDSGELILEIVNLVPGRLVPGTVVRSRTVIPPASISGPPEVHTFDLDSHPSMSAGDRFAIVLRNETGLCKALKGPTALDGSSYPSGEGFFRRSTGPADAWLQFLDFGDTGDLGFKTIVNVPVGSPPCNVRGFTFPFPSFLPVCRCLEDDGLRDFRCALLHPDYFLARHIPMPIHPNEEFKVQWTLTVFASMKGVIELTDPLTPAFGNAPKAPLPFFVEQVPPGQSITVSYTAIAPAKPGKYRVASSVGAGSMETVIEVVP